MDCPATEALVNFVGRVQEIAVFGIVVAKERQNLKRGRSERPRDNGYFDWPSGCWVLGVVTRADDPKKSCLALGWSGVNDCLPALGIIGDRDNNLGRGQPFGPQSFQDFPKQLVQNTARRLLGAPRRPQNMRVAQAFGRGGRPLDDVAVKIVPPSVAQAAKSVTQEFRWRAPKIHRRSDAQSVEAVAHSPVDAGNVAQAQSAVGRFQGVKLNNHQTVRFVYLGAEFGQKLIRANADRTAQIRAKYRF